jgi:hypothetical protein
MKKIIFFLLLSLSAFAQNKHIRIPITGGLGSSVGDTGITSLTIAVPTGLGVSPSTLAAPGTFTFTLNNDLLALENLTIETGIAVRTAANTWALRNITGTGGIAITNNGLTGDIVIDGSAIGGGGGTTDLTWSGITAGGATLNSSSGTDVILNVSGALSISGASGGITITNTFSETPQTFNSTSTANTHTLTLASGGSLQLVEGTGVTLTTSGTALNAIVTIDATGGGGGSPTDLFFTGSTTATLNSSTGTDVTITQGAGLVFSTSSGNLTLSAVDQNASNELQTLFWSTISSATGSFTISSGNTISLIAGANVTFQNSGGNLQINANTSGLSGGSTNFVTKWTSSTTVGTSIIQDNGSTIGVGTSPIAGYITQWPDNSSIRIGSTGASTNRIFFGDGTYVSVGEEGADDRLYLRGSSMSFNINGSLGASGQVLTSNGSTASWQTPAGGGSGGNMSLSGLLIHTISGTSGSLRFVAGTNMSIAFTGTSADAILTFNATGGGGATNLSWGQVSNTAFLTSSTGNTVSLVGGAGLTFSGLSGSSITLSAVDNSATNELQSLSWTTISTGSGFASFNASSSPGGALTIYAGAGLTLSNSGGSPMFVAVDQNATNELQTLSLVSNTLSISLGNSVSLAGYVDTWNVGANGSYTAVPSATNVNFVGTGIATTSRSGTTITVNATEAQTLSLVGSTLTISGTGSSVVLPGGAGTNLGFTSLPPNSVYLTSSTGSSVAITAGLGVSFSSISGSGMTINADDNSNMNELQTLSLVSNTLSISSGNSVSLAAYVNTDAQTLSLVGNTLSISGGNNVSLAGYAYTWNVGANASYASVTNGTSVNFVGTGTVSTSRSGSTITINGTGGTVTSVGLSVPSGMSVSNTPITGAGTISIAVTSLEVMPSGLSSSQVVFIDGSSTLAGNSSFTYNSGTATLTTDKHIVTGTATGSGWTLPLKFSNVTGYNGQLVFIDGSGNLTLADQGFYNNTTQTMHVIDLNLNGIPTFPDNASAAGAGLTNGDVYKTATGELRIKY